MATQSVVVNVSSGVAAGGAGDVGASLTTHAAAVATLVADGASPTQAHVTAANAALAPLQTQLSGDFTVIVNLAKITSLNQLQAAWARALQIFQGSGTVVSK